MRLKKAHCITSCQSNQDARDLKDNVRYGYVLIDRLATVVSTPLKYPLDPN